MEFLLFIGVIFLIFWVNSLSNRLSKMEDRLKRQSSQPAKAEPMVQQEAAKEIRQEYNELLHKPATAEQAPQKLTLEPEPQKSAPADKKQELDMDNVFTAGWLNRIGVVALVIGMVFFFKFAIDQGWIGQWPRIVIGLLVGGLLIFLGELWKEKFGSRAQALSGGGIALIYFTIYAGYQFYSLFPQPVAFALFVITAAGSIWMSFRNSSLVLGTLGFFGAYGAPIFLSSGQDQQIQLFFYLFILNIAVLIILLKKLWLELLALSLIGTIIDFYAWGLHFSTQANTMGSLFFVVATNVLLIMALVGMIRYHKQRNSLPEILDVNSAAIVFICGLFYFITSFWLLTDHFHDMLAPVSLLGGAMFMFAYSIIDRLEYKNLNYALSFIGSVLLTMAAYWQFHGRALALAWLALGLLGVTIGSLLKREEVRMWSIIVLFAALAKSVLEPYGLGDQVFLFNAKFGLMFANTLALLFAGWLYDKYPSPNGQDKTAHAAFEIIAVLLLWASVSWDIHSSIIGHTDLWYSQWICFWWILFPTLLAFLAFAAGKKHLMSTAAALIVISMIWVVTIPYDADPAFIFNTKFGLMFIQTAALLFIANLAVKRWGEHQLGDMFKVMASLLMWFAVSWEITEYFRNSDSENARNLLLSLWWIIYAVILLTVSSFAESAIFRKVSFLLFGLSILKVFLYDVQALDTPYRIVAFIVLGVILLTVSFVYQKNKSKITQFLQGEKVVITDDTIKS